MNQTRQIIVTVAGHVDHGKTTMLDNIRGTAITNTEAGKITQAIGASIIPIETIKKVCGNLLKKVNMKFNTPGLLFIDTPGHAAFTNIRKRGGNLADIAIIVIDINDGIKPQTEEVIEILKQYKTPFIIAANKIDIIAGWNFDDKKTLLENINAQSTGTITELEKKMYELVGKLAEHGLNAERFDRIEDYTKQVAVIPTSAINKQGIPELLMTLTGLSQKYLETCLKCDVEGAAKGTVIEVKEEKGLGKTIDVIIYDGKIKVNDTIVIGTLSQPIVTKVRALLEPQPLAEMRDKKAKFKPVKEAFAATGIKISAPNLDNAVAGMPIIVAQNNIEEAKLTVQKEISEVIIETDKLGIIIKADTLGSLEALTNLLKEKNIPIRKASIGEITKKDTIDAETNYEKDPLDSVILGFNVEDASHLCDDKVKIITDKVIYKLIENFEEWKTEIVKKQQASQLDNVITPCRIEIMKGYVFRQNNPAVVGVDILAGTLKNGTALMKKDGKIITEVKQIQFEQKSIDKAEKGKQVALSLPNVTVGRQINEEDILYSVVPESDFKKMKELKDLLSGEEKGLLKEIAEIMRERSPVWGV